MTTLRIAGIVLVLSFCATYTSFAQNKKDAKYDVFTNSEYCHSNYSAFDKYDSLWFAQIRYDTIATERIKQNFTQTSRSVARDLGIMSLLDKLLLLEEYKVKNKMTDSMSLLYWEVRQMITERINLANLEIAIVLAEIECEQDRAIDLQYHLGQKLAKKVNRATVVSILAGAITTFAASYLVLNEFEAQQTEAVISGGAFVSAFFGIQSLFMNAKAPFMHKRNYLRDIWENPKESTLFPPMIWHFLTREFENTSQDVTARELIIQRWEDLELFSSNKSKEQERIRNLFFGDGGTYSIDDIDSRIVLLDLLETEINVMNQELKQLQQEILVLK